MTTGERLKQRFHLEKVNARISRVIGYPLQLYYIFYDTARPTQPLYWARVKQDSRNVSLLKDFQGKTYPVAPLLDLEDFNGESKTSYFILVDMAGQRQINSSLVESITLADLKNTASDLTKKFMKIRNKSTGTENRLTKLIQVVYQGDNLRFSFLTVPTNDNGSKEVKRDIYNTDPRTGKLVIDKSKTYEMELEILDFKQWLDTYPKDYKITAKDIKEILEIAYVKVWSNDPSFTWQGVAFRLTQLDGAIYPVDIPDSVWRDKHGDSFVTKHLAGLINGIGFWYIPMANITNTYLKSKGLL